MRGCITVLVAFVAAGCSYQLTRGGGEVRPVTPERAAGCVALGSVEGSHANAGSVAENEHAATDDARNQVAKRGGNALVVTRRTSGAWRSVVEGDAYRCAQYEPVPGLAPEQAPAAAR
jgi:hypothetical protein